MRRAIFFALLAFIGCDPAYAQLPSCEDQLVRERDRSAVQWGMIQTCHSRLFHVCESTNCSAPDATTGLSVCLSEGCQPEPVMVPEPGFGVGLAVGVVGLFAASRSMMVWLDIAKVNRKRF